MALIDTTALAQEGIPKRHAEAFVEVAEDQNCIIVSRIPGSACLDLLEAGYDAKSFHIKGKSCDWGPMAGFVCLDPLLNKKGLEGAAKNAKEHKKSLTNLYEGNTAGFTPIQIEQDHLNNLIKKEVIKVSEDSTNCLLGTVQKDNLKFSFMLEKNGTLWSLYYCLEEAYQTIKKAWTADDFVTAFTSQLGGELKEEKSAYKVVAEKLIETCPEASWKTLKNKRYVPVLAMTNPNLHYSEGDYHNAITGDYDLFAVWPFGRDETDDRVAGMKESTKNNKIIKAESKGEIGKVVGNISERIYDIAQRVNSAINQKQPQPNRVYHSDEGGRPFVEDVDLPVAVFTPKAYEKSGGYMGFIISNIADLGKLMEYHVQQGYTIFVNKGWPDSLAGHVSRALLAYSERV